MSLFVCFCFNFYELFTVCWNNIGTSSSSLRTLYNTIRGRPFNSWGVGWVISGDQEFFFLAIWWARYFFPFFSHKLSITFVLHAIFFFRQVLAGNFFSKSPTPHPPSQELNGRPLTCRNAATYDKKFNGLIDIC